MIRYCPICSTDFGITHGDQLWIEEICDDCLEKQYDEEKPMVIHYDSRGVKPAQFSDPIPQGEYILQIIKAEERRSSKGQPMVKVTCAVQPPSEFAGATVFHNVTIIPAGEPGAGIAIHFLKSIGQPWEEDENLAIDPEAWIYAKFKAFVIQDPYTYPDGKKIMTNKIKGLEPLPEREIDF